jgi:hypothetical protein
MVWALIELGGEVLLPRIGPHPFKMHKDGIAAPSSASRRLRGNPAEASSVRWRLAVAKKRKRIASKFG